MFIMYMDSELWLCVFSVLVSLLLRCGTTLHPYSGKGQPPMYGDYEAQRHWMEITVNLPLNQWYHNTTENNLQYWGLDYPPLTAYHSYICGAIARLINPDYVALYSSRGYESEEHKLFMRYTVLIVDVFLYIPSVILYFVFTKKLYYTKDLNVKKAKKDKAQERVRISPSLSITLALLYPGITLIDHGHFQYNCVSLAFVIYAITFLCVEQNILATIFFCFAVNYKQMELYHSLPFFLYLLSTCIPKPGQSTLSSVKKLFKISVTVLITFGIIWLPFLLNDPFQVVHRLFPVARGVFEDKVANIWCTLNVLYKFKLYFTNHQMVQYCTVATLAAVLPSCTDLFLRPNIRKFIPALINSSLAFFLFSFQVHEKSVLLIAVPAVLYMHVEPFVCFWFLFMSVFSMLPLLIKDDLILAFIALMGFYTSAFYVTFRYSKEKQGWKQLTSLAKLKDILDAVLSIPYARRAVRNLKRNSDVIFEIFGNVVATFSFTGCVVLTLLMLIFDPPKGYPDLFPLLISVYSCIHFLAFFIYFNIVQFKIPQAMEDVRHFKLKSQ